MRILVAAVGRLKQGLGARTRRSLSQARRNDRPRFRPSRDRNRRNSREPRARCRTPARRGIHRNRQCHSRTGDRGHPRRAGRQPRQRVAGDDAAQVARGGPFRRLLHHRRRRRAGAKPARARQAQARFRQPRPGRTSWSASCCWSSFIAPARSWPATPITGPEQTGRAAQNPVRETSAASHHRIVTAKAFAVLFRSHAGPFYAVSLAFPRPAPTLETDDSPTVEPHRSAPCARLGFGVGAADWRRS